MSAPAAGSATVGIRRSRKKVQKQKKYMDFEIDIQDMR